jgi:hypothetical protein
MIYDRTQADVDEAVRIRKEKVQNFEDLTEEDIRILERGTLTINTLNRIEEKQEELKNLFAEDFYFSEAMEHKSWTYTDYFKKSDFDRISKNLDSLKEAYFTYASTPDTPNNNYTKFETINDIEKILYDLDIMINDVKSNYRECGTIECGEDI